MANSRLQFRLSWLCVLMAAAAVLVVARMAWVTSRTMTGWKTVGRHWADATLAPFGPFGRSRVIVPIASPRKQAEYWLAEADRILDAQEPSAELAMGAAWVLDAPSLGFWEPVPPPLLGTFHRHDDESENDADRAWETFETRCRNKCLELAARATTLEPDDVRWWRLRAWLLFKRGAPFICDWVDARDGDWDAVLDEASRHDPDNALYDYLAAIHHWTKCGDFVSRGNSDSLSARIVDFREFDRGVVRYEQAQCKKCVAIGEAGLNAMVEFLRRSDLTLGEQAQAASSCQILACSNSLLATLWRWQMARIDDDVSEGNFADALALARQNLRFLEQFSAGGESAVHDKFILVFREGSLKAIRELARDHDELVSNAESAAIDRALRDAMLRHKVYREAALKPANAFTSQKAVDFASHVVLAFSPLLLNLLFLAAAIGAVVERALAARSEVTACALGVWRHVIAWGAAWALVFVVVGLAPAEVIGRSVQAWSVVIVIVFVLPAAALLACRAGKYQFSLRTLMGLIGAYAVLLLIPVYGRSHWDVFNTFPPAFSVPERGWNGFKPEVCRYRVLAPKESWEWAMWQWIAYSGIEISVIASLLFVGLWSTLRCRRRTVADSAPGCNERMRVPFAAVIRCVSRSALALACGLALVYLAILPTVLNTIDDEYRSRTGYLSDPLQGWEAVEAAIVSVESDPAAMQRLRGFVDSEMGESDSPNAE